MKLEDITLSEISRSQKDKQCVTPLTWGTKIVRLTEAETRMVLTRGWEEGKVGSCSVGLKLQLFVTWGSSRDLLCNTVPTANNMYCAPKNVLRG